MKYLHTAFLTVFFGVTVLAQNVYIPDANFKNRLIELGVDTDQDGEIQISEAILVEYLFLQNSEISSLVGIQKFHNLRELYCQNNFLTDLPVSSLEHLKRLNCNNNQIASFSFDYSGLFELRCANNQLTSIAVSPGIVELDISYNQIDSLVLPDDIDYGYLNISGNSYETVLFDDLRIDNLYCNDTQIQSLDFSDVYQLGETISIKNNLKLEWINFKNGEFDFCYVIGGGCHFYMILEGNPLLSRVCLDTFPHPGPTVVTELEYFQSQYNLPNIEYNSLCTNAALANTIFLNQEIKVYPNPVRDLLTMAVPEGITVSSVSIYNTIGQLVKTMKPTVSNSISISFSDISAGSYIVEMQTNTGTFTSKLIKI